MAKKDEAKPAAAAESDKAPKGGKGKIVLLSVLGVLLVGGGAVAGTLALTGGFDKLLGKAPAAVHEAQAGAGEARSAAPAPEYYPFEEPFVVNLLDEQGLLRYVQVKVTLMARDRKVFDHVKTNRPYLENELNFLFAAQKFAQLLTPGGKEHLRQASLERVREVLQKTSGNSGIEAVFFTSFVMQ